MIEINLAPGAESGRPSARRRPTVSLPKVPTLGFDSPGTRLGAAVFALVLVLGFMFWRGSRRVTELEAQVQAEAVDSTRFATTIELLQSLRARQDTIQQKIGVIQEVDQRRYVWPHILDEISGSVPPFTWLTEIQTAGEEGADPAAAALTFTIQGNAGSTQALTGMMKNLEESPFIRAVTLVTSEQQEQGGRSVHRFTLEAKYEMPDVTALETVPIIPVE